MTFHLSITYPPSMQFPRIANGAKAALAAFDAFAAEAPKTVDVPRQRKSMKIGKELGGDWLESAGC